MSNVWTKAQSEAISARGKTLLISAAAGSGKTSTLTERIIRDISTGDSPADISKMLIVTFTRSAAADLKTKISTALGNAIAEAPANRHLQSQLIKLGNAKICTIDSFYLDILRKNFSDAGLSSSFRIADETEIDIMSKRLMQDVIDYFYGVEKKYPVFCECFSSLKDSEAQTGVFIDLYSHLLDIPEGIEFLSNHAQELYEYAEKEFMKSSYGAIISEYMLCALEDFKDFYECEIQRFDGMPTSPSFIKTFSYDLELCKNLIDLLGSDGTYGQLREALSAVSFPKLTFTKDSKELVDTEYYKYVRNDFKDKIKEFSTSFFTLSEENLKRCVLETAENLSLLYKTLAEFEARFVEEKKRRGIVTFSDIKRLTLKLLVAPDGSPTPLAKSYAEQFSDVYIDEYQDVDSVQDLIFSSISKPDNRFMVGDVKQSIYTFRGAKPQLFASYRRAFPLRGTPDAADSLGETIVMSNNFRCSKPVIDFSNKVCSRLFYGSRGELGYTSDDDLVFSKNVPKDAVSAKVEVAAIFQPTQAELRDGNYSDGQLTSFANAEAIYIADEICKLLADGRLENGEKIRPSDIAVLYRSGTAGSVIAKELRARGINVSSNDSEKYFKSPDVLMLLAILNAVDNPRRDIHLAGTLRSPIFDFSMDELLLVRSYGAASDSLYDALLECAKESSPLGEKCAEFAKKLDLWRFYAQSVSVDKFLKYLFSTDEFIASGLVSERVEMGAKANLMQLYEYARRFENGSFKGLYNFISYVDSLIEGDKKMPLSAKDKRTESVKVTTIHDSKGLEFPVCFICNSAAAFNNRDSEKSLCFKFPFGIAMQLADEGGFARLNTPMREAIAVKIKQESVEDEMRVLYVALTRARERLYVTGKFQKNRSEINFLSNVKNRRLFAYGSSIYAANSYMEWVFDATGTEASEDEPYNLSVLRADALVGDSSRSLQSQGSAVAEPDTELLDALRRDYAFTYPHSALSRLPAKLSVSRLSPSILDEESSLTELSLRFEDDGSDSFATPDYFLYGKGARKPTPAERGTATHAFLQFCDFKRVKSHGVKYELTYLIENKFLPSGADELIYLSELERLSQSELMDMLLSAKRTWREQRFNVTLPAEIFTRDEDFREKIKGETIAVQGVIDVVVEDADGRLCLFDYKTDRLTPDELSDDSKAIETLSNRHSAQLFYYAEAISRMLCRPVDRIGIYSTHAAKIFDITPEPPQNLYDSL